jgi:hypothetical protein
MNENVERSAEFFGRSYRGGSWTLALAVASCVQRGCRRVGWDSAPSSVGKVTVSQFAELAGIAPSTVTRYWEGWVAAAKEGVVAKPSDLAPEDWDNEHCLPKHDEAWGDFVPAHDLQAGRVVNALEREEDMPEQVVAKMQPETRKALRRAIDAHESNEVQERYEARFGIKPSNELVDAGVDTTEYDRRRSAEEAVYALGHAARGIESSIRDNPDLWDEGQTNNWVDVRNWIDFLEAQLLIAKGMPADLSELAQ